MYEGTSKPSRAYLAKINIANLFWHKTILQGSITLCTRFDLSAMFMYADDKILIDFLLKNELTRNQSCYRIPSYARNEHQEIHDDMVKTLYEVLLPIPL